MVLLESSVDVSPNKSYWSGVLSHVCSQQYILQFCWLMRTLISCLRSVHQILFQRLRAETCHTIHLKKLPMICLMELVELPMRKIAMAQWNWNLMVYRNWPLMFLLRFNRSTVSRPLMLLQIRIWKAPKELGNLANLTTLCSENNRLMDIWDWHAS